MYAHLSAYERFMSYVDDSAGPDACHPWTGHISNRGYGRFNAGGRPGQSATRWILGYLRDRPLAPGELALHRCDNPVCCNPRHLYIGDQVQNMADMVRRGRGRNLLADRHRAKTHCPRGHEYTPENTRRNGRGSRECLTCAAARRVSKSSSAQPVGI